MEQSEQSVKTAQSTETGNPVLTQVYRAVVKEIGLPSKVNTSDLLVTDSFVRPNRDNRFLMGVTHEFLRDNHKKEEDPVDIDGVRYELSSVRPHVRKNDGSTEPLEDVYVVVSSDLSAEERQRLKEEQDKRLQNTGFVHIPTNRYQVLCPDGTTYSYTGGIDEHTVDLPGKYHGFGRGQYASLDGYVPKQDFWQKIGKYIKQHHLWNLT